MHWALPRCKTPHTLRVPAAMHDAVYLLFASYYIASYTTALVGASVRREITLVESYLHYFGDSG